MSAQGTVRYALLMDDQATAKLNTFKNSLTGLTTPTSTVTKNMGALQSNFSGVSGAAQDMIVKQTTLTQKLSTVGAAFKNHALAVAATASSIISLVENYTSLQKSQLLAQKSAVQVDTAQRSLDTATRKLLATQNKYGASSKEAARAQNDVKIATDKLGIAQERNTLNQDKLNEATANFATNILPNVILAGGGVTEMITTFTSKGGALSGVMSKLGGSFSGLGGSILGLDGPIKGLKGNLLGIGGIASVGIGGVIVVFDELNAAMKDLHDVSTKAITPTKALGNEFDRWAKFDFSTIEGIANAVIRGFGPAVPLLQLAGPLVKKMVADEKESNTVSAQLIEKQNNYNNALATYNQTLDGNHGPNQQIAKDNLDRAKTELDVVTSISKVTKGTDNLYAAGVKYNAIQKTLNTTLPKVTSEWDKQAQSLSSGNVPSLNAASNALIKLNKFTF